MLGCVAGGAARQIARIPARQPRGSLGSSLGASHERVAADGFGSWAYEMVVVAEGAEARGPAAEKRRLAASGSSLECGPGRSPGVRGYTAGSRREHPWMEDPGSSVPGSSVRIKALHWHGALREPRLTFCRSAGSFVTCAVWDRAILTRAALLSTSSGQTAPLSQVPISLAHCWIAFSNDVARRSRVGLPLTCSDGGRRQGLAPITQSEADHSGWQSR